MPQPVPEDQRQADAVKAAEAHLSKMDDELPAMLELARQWKPGMLRSAYTMPLVRLQHDTEQMIAELGGKPDQITAPRNAHPDEDGVPVHVRQVIRRLPRLRAELHSRHDEARRSGAEE